MTLPTSAQPPSNRETHPSIQVVLIHGVGNPAGGTIRSSAAPLVRALGLKEEQLSEINWNSVVEHPVALGLLDLGHLAALMRGIIGSANRDASRPGESGLDPRASRIFSVLLLTLYFAPPMLIWILVVALSWLRPADSTLGGFLTKAFIVVDAFLPLQLLEEWLWITEAYFTLVLALATFLMLSRFRDDGLNGLRIAARQVVLLVSWPIVFLSGILLSWANLAVFAILPAFAMLLTVRNSATISIAGDGVPSITTHADPLDFIVLLISASLCFVIAKVTLTVAVGPFLKIAADIARYLGDADYRSRLLSHVLRRLRDLRLSPNDQLVLVGHSLGSLIALDAMLAPACPLPKEQRLVVVTLGSPIRRLLARFFPYTIPEPDALARRLTQSFGRSAWVNAYRPLDPIGARLFSNDTPKWRDVSTRQWLRVGIAAHTGYWSDVVVVNAVTASVNGARAGSQRA